MDTLRQTCDHIGFFTKNMEAMTEFYTRVLGFQLGKESVLSRPLTHKIFGLADECRFVKLHRNGFVIEMFEPRSARLHKRMTSHVSMNHWGYCVVDRETFVKELRSRGIDVIEIKRNSNTVYFLIDPDGNRIEIRDHPE